MTYSFFASTFAGLLQLAVPSYGLRLHRHFGSRRVGWALVAAFWGLALLNLAGRMGPAGARPEWESARGLVAVVIPLLLLIGLAHVETRFRERARVERELRLRHDDLERCLDRRTEELAEAREEFHRERNRRGEHQRAFAEGARQERLELGVQVAARAGQHLNRHAAVFELYAKLLVAKHSEPGTARHHERLAAGAAEMRALGRQLLACGGCQPVRPQLISLSDLVRRHQPALQTLLGEHRLLQCVCPANAPLVWADPQLVRWMLEELVRNARDAMADAVSVSIVVVRGDADQPPAGLDPGARQFVSLVVTDTGRGMGRDIQQHLGEPFFTTRPDQHSGLGLASVSGLAKSHGGWMTVTSALGHGSSVHLYFPCATAAPSATPHPGGLTASLPHTEIAQTLIGPLTWVKSGSTS